MEALQALAGRPGSSRHGTRPIACCWASVWGCSYSPVKAWRVFRRCGGRIGSIPGRVERLSVASDLVLPHVGWNALHWHSPASPLAQGLPEGGDMYFVHSYAFLLSNPAHGLAASDYGGSFTTVRSRCLLRRAVPPRKKPASRASTTRELPGLAAMLKRRLIPKLQWGYAEVFVRPAGAGGNAAVR